MPQYEIFISFITVILKNLQKNKEEHRTVYKSRQHMFLDQKKKKV